MFVISIVIVLVASTAARVAAMPDPDNSRDYKYFKVDFKDYVDIKDEGTTIVIDQNVYPTAAASNKKEVIEAAGDKKSEAFRVGDIKEINAIPDSTPIKNDEQSEEEEPEYEYYYVYEDYDEEYGDDQDYDYESGEDGGEAEVLPPVTEVSFREAPGPTPRVPVLEGVVIESIKKSNPFLKTSEGLKTLDNLADESEAVGNIEQDEGTAKTERSADHSHGGHHHQNSIFNPATITNGWVPSTFLQSTPKPLVSTGASTVFFQQGPPRPIEGTYIPVTTTTLPPPPPPPPPQPAVPAGINSYIPPNPVRTADIPTPPKPTLPPATSYGSPQIVFIQESNYVAPAPTPRPRPPKPTYQKPRPSYLKPRPQYHNTHHYARPAYRPYSTTRRPESPRNYFPAPDIPGVLEDEGASTLLDLLEQADLIRDLAGEGPFTLFAPTNEAFSKLDPNLVSTLTDDQDLLRSVLLYHVVPRKLFSRNFNDDVTLDTLLDEAGEQKKLRLTMNKENKIITVNGAEIIQDLMDQTAKNGIIHFVDEVIYPIPAGSIVDVLAEDNRFRVLTDAIESANLTAALNSTGPFTIFAPTDDAFDELPRQAVEELFNDTEALVALLKKHVVPSTKLSPSLTFVTLMTLGKEKIKVRIRRGQVFVEDARLIDGDIIATNGAIQVIDKVLL